MKFLYRSRGISVLIGAAIVLIPSITAAQDTHYWNNQYGPRAMLLGGNIIGSVSDMSATFYNPGAIGYIETPELILSANVYQRATLKVEDGGGDGIDLQSTDFNPLPNMLAGAFRFSWAGDNKLAYSVLTRHRFKTRVDGALIGNVDIFENTGDDRFAGGISFESNVKDLWVGLSWARGVRERIGVGVTGYVSYRTLDTSARQFAEALSDSNDFAISLTENNYSSQHYSLLAKIGLAFDLRPLTLGITLTTPNIGIFETGDATINSTLAGVDTTGDNVPDNGFEADVQQDVTANYKSPLSVGAGAAYQLRRTTIHASVEWFSSVGAYDVLELDGFESQTTGETIQRRLRHKLDSVFNYGIGLEHSFGDRRRAFLSFNSDFSAFNPESDISVTPYDIYHLTGGGTLTMGRVDVTLGLAFAFASSKINQPINLNPDEGESIIDPDRLVDLSYRRMTFIFGFSVGL